MSFTAAVRRVYRFVVGAILVMLVEPGCQPAACPPDGGLLPNLVAHENGGPCATGRHTDDQPDDSDADQIHVMYVLASDTPDEALDTNGAIETSVTAANRWLHEKAGARHLRFDTCEGRLDTTFVRIDRTNDALVRAAPDRLPTTLEQELSARGLLRAHKIYAIYYGGAYSQCGQADSPPDNPGQVAVVFPRGGDFIKVCGSPTPCETAPGKIEAGLVHEVFHVLGAVATCAPHFDPARRGHVSDEGDLMNGVHLASPQNEIDIGNDDYFGHQNSGCVDVARSTFLEPAVSDAVEPPGWSMGVPGSITSGPDGGTGPGDCRTLGCPPGLQCCTGGMCASMCP